MQLSTKVNNFRHPFDTLTPPNQFGIHKDLSPPQKKNNRNLRLSVRFLLRFKSSYSSPVTNLWPLSCRVLKGGVQGEVAVTGHQVAIFVLPDPLIVVLPTRRVPTIDVVEFTKSCIIDTNVAFIRHPIGREDRTICLEDSATMLHHQFQVECDIHRLPSSRSHKLSHIGAPWWHSNEVVVGSATWFRPSPRNQTCLALSSAVLLRRFRKKSPNFWLENCWKWLLMMSPQKNKSYPWLYSQIGSFPQISGEKVKIRNIWNHHLVHQVQFFKKLLILVFKWCTYYIISWHI